MRSLNQTKPVKAKLILLAFAVVALLIQAGHISGQEQAGAVTPAQESFATPQLAATALIEATGSFDVAALKQILGPGSEAIVATQDSVLDKNNAAAFAAK